jgi:hypothetical protein
MKNLCMTFMIVFVCVTSSFAQEEDDRKVAVYISIFGG